MPDEFGNLDVTIDQAIMPTEPTTVQATPPSNETQTIPNQTPEVADDVIMNHPKYKDAVRGMGEAQRSAAEYRKIMEDFGVQDTNQLRQVIEFAAQARNNRQQTPQQAQQQTNQQDEYLDNLYASDPDFEKAVDKLIEKKYGQKLQQIDQLSQFQNQTAFNSYKSDVQTAAKTLLNQYQNTGIEENQLIDFAIKNKVPPSGVFHALIEAMGGHQKFQEYSDKAAVARFIEENKKNSSSVSSTLKTPGTQATPAALPTNPDDYFDHLADSGAQLIAAMKQNSG